MKNNYTSSKIHKTALIALLLLFCGLFANKAAAQTAVANNDTFIWTGLISSAWDNAGNWTILRGTTTAGGNTYPGEIGTTDVVFINKNDTPFPAILDGQTLDIARLNVANTFGTETGAIFTINSGATLNVGNLPTPTGQANNVILSGGSILNNGTLNIYVIGTGSSGFPPYGINCGNPSVPPTVPREYSYSGSGTLSISMLNGTIANTAAVAITGQSANANVANATYKIVLNNPTITLNQASTVAIAAIRAAGITAALPNTSKLLISGTGFTIGTVGTPSIGSLINVGSGGYVTVDTGTSLTLNSAAANLNHGIVCSNSANNIPTVFTNKGTINIIGPTSRSGLSFSTFGGSSGNPSTTPQIINFTNEGTITANVNSSVTGFAAYSVTNGGGGAANAGSFINLTNSSTGILTLKNTSTAVGTGNAIYCFSGSEGAFSNFVNNGTLNLEGTVYNYGSKTTINNNGILNTNSELRSFAAVNNNSGGSINFVRTAATATTRQVTFTITTSTDISGALGSIYKDSNNNQYAIVVQKFGTGTNLVANVISGATIPATGTLTRVSTGTGSASIAYEAVTIPSLNNAVVGTVANSGTINTDTAANLNIVSAPTTTATSVLSPGGDTGKGILTIPDFPAAAAELWTLLGTLKIQASGSAIAGVDYDQMRVTGALDVIDISGATLDLTGLYTPAALTTIDILTTNANVGFEGAVVGEFASVVGLPAKWTVVYNPGLGSKVQLVYDPTLGTAQFADFKFSVYPNPTSSELNVSAAKNISRIELFNILGQRVQSENVQATQKQLNISNLQKGIYVMEVTIDSAKQSFKIVKQ